jgi:hypothetical protein
MFFVCLFLMPETLFDRPTDDDGLKSSTRHQIHIEGEKHTPPSMTRATYLNRLWFIDLEKPSSRQLRAVDFVVKPLSMLKYPSVAFPALY